MHKNPNQRLHHLWKLLKKEAENGGASSGYTNPVDKEAKGRVWKWFLSSLLESHSSGLIDRQRGQVVWLSDFIGLAKNASRAQGRMNPASKSSRTYRWCSIGGIEKSSTGDVCPHCGSFICTAPSSWAGVSFLCCVLSTLFLACEHLLCFFLFVQSVMFLLCHWLLTFQCSQVKRLGCTGLHPCFDIYWIVQVLPNPVSWLESAFISFWLHIKFLFNGWGLCFWKPESPREGDTTCCWEAEVKRI